MRLLYSSLHELPHEGLQTNNRVGTERVAKRLVESNVASGYRRMNYAENCDDNTDEGTGGEFHTRKMQT